MSQTKRLLLSFVLVAMTLACALPMLALSYLSDVDYQDHSSTIVAPNPPKITFDANGGYFENGETTRTVEIVEPSTYEKHVVTSDNFADIETGSKAQGYGYYPNGKNQVVTIPGAEKLKVTITYQTYYSSSTAWVSLYDGNTTPSKTNYSSSVSGKLSGSTKKTETFEVEGDTAQLFFVHTYNNVSALKYYGFYAEVEGYGYATTNPEYIEPESETKTFAGWSLSSDSDQTIDVWGILEEDTNLYAVWREPDAYAAIYGATSDASENLSLIFGKKPRVPETYEDKCLVESWSNIEKNCSASASITLTNAKWNDYEKYKSISEIKAIDLIQPSSTAGWFSENNTSSSYQNKTNATFDLSLLDLSKTTNMGGMFRNANYLTDSKIQDSGLIFDLTNTSSIFGMFSYCKNLTSISFTGDPSSVSSIYEAFYDCSKLKSINGLVNLNVKGIMNDAFYGCRNLIEIDTSTWTVASTSMSRAFYNCQSLTSIGDISNWDVSKVTNADKVFHSCSKLDNIGDLSSWNTSNMTNMSGMFYNCSKLSTVGNISNWDTSNVTDMSSVFYGCSSLASLDLSNWNTSKVTNMSNMFRSCSNLASIDFSNWDTSNVTNMSGMFYSCSSLVESPTIDLSNFDTSNVKNMSYMFYSYMNKKRLSALDLSTFDTSNVTNMSYMFRSYSSNFELDLSTFDTSNVTNMEGTFSYYLSENKLNLIPLDTSNVTSMKGMFSYYKSVQPLDVSSLNTSKVANMTEMFYGSTGLQSLDLSTFDTSNVTNMSGMFGAYGSYNDASRSGCYNLKEIKGLENWDTSKVTNMSYMFDRCWSLASLDLSKWDTSNITTMKAMFNMCDSNGSYPVSHCGGSLTSLDLSNFDTSKVTSMTSMFCGNLKLENINLSSFNTSNVTDMSEMFAGCSSLSELNISNFDTSKVEGFGGVGSYVYLGMFTGCSSLESLDLSSFDTSNAKSMKYLFAGCTSLKIIDLSNFDTSKVTNTNYMFQNCTALTTIYASNLWSSTAITTSSNMFTSCKSLVGGSQTPFDSTKTDKEYARIDTPETPGYFTLKTTEATIDFQSLTQENLSMDSIASEDIDSSNYSQVSTDQSESIHLTPVPSTEDQSSDGTSDTSNNNESNRDLNAKEEDVAPPLAIVEEDTSDDLPKDDEEENIIYPLNPENIKEYIYAEDGSVQGFILTDQEGNENELLIVNDDEIKELQKDDDIEMYATEIIQINEDLYQRIYVKNYPTQQLLVKITDDNAKDLETISPLAEEVDNYVDLKGE